MIEGCDDEHSPQASIAGQISITFDVWTMVLSAICNVARRGHTAFHTEEEKRCSVCVPH